MFLDVKIDDEIYQLNIPDEFIKKAKDFFDKMDADLDKGWQLNREWVQNPSKLQRCQVAADKLFSALENENDKLGRLMAGYICSRMPDVQKLEIDPSGEISGHLFTTGSSSSISVSSIPENQPENISPERQAALDEAEKQVSQVFKVGRQYRYTVYNPRSANWEESPTIGSKEQAENLRSQAVNQRANELLELFG